jgi:ABC-type branched-subunit amino acid transport system permease subunit
MVIGDLELAARKGAGWLGVVAASLVSVAYIAAVLSAETQLTVISLIAAGAVGIGIAGKLGWIASAQAHFARRQAGLDLLIIVSFVLVAGYFHNNTFVLFLISTVLIYVIACLGLNIQFGFAGMLNFAGGAMLGIGGYAAALLGNTSIPTIAILPLGGLAAAVIGSILLPPMLRTRGHYSAVITIAFNLLFTTFLDAYEGLGGPQGLPVRGASLFSWSFNENIQIADFTIAFYANYITLGLAMVLALVALIRRMERSWIGLNLDSLRLDETSSKCFGINLVAWKIAAFTTGNFIIGMAGTLYAIMLGYIAPSNFTFGDSLILVTIILLGGLGSIWGTVITTAIIIVLPEKLQVIQEYRLLLFAILVTLVLLFRPEGLLPRSARQYFPDWRP